MTPLRIAHSTVTTALGRGRGALAAALIEERTGLAPLRFEDCQLECWTGEVDGLELPVSGALAPWDCRNNRLARLGLAQDGFTHAVVALSARHGADRVGVYVGTSTAGVQQTERAYAERDPADGPLPSGFDYRRTHNIHSVAEFVRLELGLAGPSVAISTACSSSAKVFASAARAIAAGLCDAAVVGGVDTLCLTTLHGFNSLQLISADVCRPADVARQGISIGEAAGFAILEAAQGSDREGLWLTGVGESSDAHHMSTPDPEGRGALASMRAALARGGVERSDVGYINLHGTGTPANDLSEDRAVAALFGADTPCSSTKGWTGHALGAAGIVEAVITMLCLEHQFLPRSLNTRDLDPQLHSGILMGSRHTRMHYAMSNSFGFGGSNCSLLFGIQS